MDGQSLIRFFEAIYGNELEADEIKKGISDDLKSYAENNEVNPKALKTAYSLFKKFRSGKNTAVECEDYAELSDIVNNYFASDESKGV